MSTKNYYQDKGNNTSGAAGGGRSGSEQELKKRIAELEKQQRRHEQALEQAVDAIITIDGDKNITFFNQAAEQLFGYTRDEVMGHNVKVIVPLEHQSKHDQYVDANISTGINKVVGMGRDLSMSRKDGTKFWGNLSLSKCDVDGEVQYTAFIKDISVQKNNVDEMQRIQRELETRMAQIDTACLVSETDVKGNITFVNDKFCEVAGYTREELMGQNHNIVRHPDMPKAYFKELWSTIGKGNIFRGVIKNKAKDGSAYWVDAMIAPVLGPNGKPVKYIGVRYDITEQKQKEEELKHAVQEALDLKLRNEQTLEQAVDSVISIDEDKNIIFFNATAEKMFGYSRQEVIGKNVKMIVPMEHQGVHDSYVDNNRSTGINKVVGLGRDLEMVHRNGTRFWGNLSLSKVQFNGQVLYTAFIKDITITKHNELGFKEVIGAIQHLAEGKFDFRINIDGLNVDESVQRIVGVMHEFRDNLQRILNEVKHVLESAGTNGNLNARLNLQDTRGEWKSLIDLINQLLQSLAEPVLEFNKIVTEMANGDLTQRFQMHANGDIKNMGDALNKAINNLNELLFTIGYNADVVASSSVNMLEKTESMKRNTSEVASAISQMAKGAQDQASRTDDSSKLVEQVMRSSNDMERKANLINKAAERGQKSSENGVKIIHTLVNHMTGINEAAGQTSRSMDVLTRRAEEIGRTLNVITDIASQTNLLALNAAIEAARAGDAGRGFAVVAEEIRKLAEDSRKSAVEIEKIISDVQKDTQSAGKAIDTMQSSVKDGSRATKEAEEIFQEITTSSNETFSFSKEILEATAGQKSSIDTVVRNIEQIVVVAEETAAGTQEVASSSQQLSNAMGDITDGSNKMASVAAELQAGINMFKLKRGSVKV